MNMKHLWTDDWLTSGKISRRSDIPDSERSRKRSGGPFADPVNQRYQLDTEAHIRAAWSYLGMPKNASKYSATDLASIKKRVIAAWKKVIDPAGPPSA